MYFADPDRQRPLAVAGGSLVSAFTAALNLGYQVTLFALLGASHTLDEFYLCRTLPFLLEQLGSHYFLMVVFPGFVKAPTSLGMAFREVLGHRFTAAFLAGYLFLLACPLVFFEAVGRDPAASAVDPFVPRLLVVASSLLTFNMLVTAWFNGRDRYLVGILGSLINVAAMFAALVALRGRPTLTSVALSFSAGAAAQTAWLLAAPRGTDPGTVRPAVADPSGGRGTAQAVGMAVVGGVSPLLDRVATAWLPAGNVSIMKVGRQLLETAANVAFGALAASSYTLQCREVRDGRPPEPRLFADVRVVAWCAAILLVGLQSRFGAETLGLVFAHGRFGIEESAAFHACLVWMGPLVLLLPLRTLLVFRYLSLGRTTLPLGAAGAACAVDAGAKAALLGQGLAGIAAANSLSLVAHVAVLAAGLPRPHLRELAALIGRCGVLVALPALGSARLVPWLGVPDPLGLASLGVAAALFVPLSRLWFGATAAAMARQARALLAARAR